MDKDKKTWLIAFLVLVVVVLILSDLGVMTGQVPRAKIEKMTNVYISTSSDIVSEASPKINQGNLIYVTVETGSEGMWNRVSFYKQEGNIVVKRFAQLVLTDSNCGNNYCDANKIVSGSYAVGADWLGTYCVGVKDRATEKETKDKCFEVIA